MANGDSIEKSYAQLDGDIEALLKDDTLSTRELLKGLLRTQRSMLPFVAQVIVNTKKINIMWSVFKPALAGGGIMLSLILGFLWGIFTGQVQVIIK